MQNEADKGTSYTYIHGGSSALCVTKILMTSMNSAMRGNHNATNV